MTLIENVKSELKNLISAAAKAVIEQAGRSDLIIPEFLVEIPRDKTHGDFSTNVAMLLTKELRRMPRVIADELIANMSNAAAYIEKIDVAGAGFINFHLNNSYLYDVISQIEAQGDDFGRINVGNGKKYMIEFISANPTGPMHMGNARGGALGDSLANILDRAGYAVTKEFYINDAGNQIEKFAISLEARYIQELKGEDTVVFPEDGYQGEDIRTRAKEFIEIEGDKYLELSSEERKNALVAYGLERNIIFMKETLENYRIKYDVWFRESQLHDSGEVDAIVEVLKKSGYTYELDGALWIKSTEFGAEKDDVLIRQNGIPTYFAADIAYHANKFITRGFDKVINVWGADHHGHVARMKGSMGAIGIDPERLDILIMQLVKLVSNGEVVRMSKRTGKAISLNDLIDEIGVDAARFFFNLRQAGSHLDFDLDLAVKESNENPVYYVQYAHARICSIINLLSSEGTHVKKASEIDISALKEAQEIDLIRKLADFPEEIKVSAELYEPSRLTRYVMDLSALFHSFYNACRVKSEDKQIMNARLKLIDCTRIVIKNALDILAVSAPDKM